MVVYNNKTILGEQLWLVMLQLLIQSPLPTLKENSLKSYLLDVRWNLNHISQNIKFQQEICSKKWLLVLPVGPTLCLMIAFNFMGNLLHRTYFIINLWIEKIEICHLCTHSLFHDFVSHFHLGEGDSIVQVQV